MAASATIKAIDSTSVHRITSGQVVIDLQTAVKELVENSLDAGATSIEVRFKDYGVNSIEVIDNGHGIAPEDYEHLALKHHTSKLSSFEDLGSVLTFGFRGEALSSLCALSSSVSIITATGAQAPMGTVLEFDRNGKLKDTDGKTARQRGTSVMITGLFAPLPVRRKELEKNAKREYGKVLNLLQAYALVPCANENRGVRLTVTNHPIKGVRSVQIRTEGSPSTRASVSSLWGPKSLENIVSLDLGFVIEAERSSYLKKRGMPQEGPTSVKVRGLISRFAPGCGRTSADRQFFYVNGRPCTPTKVQKAFNEAYRSFNANQTPFVIADFQIPTTACDINVSPDKRTIFIHSENNLIEALKINLEDTFSSSRSTFSVNGASSTIKDKAKNRRSGHGLGSSQVNDNSQAASDSQAGEVGDIQEIFVEEPGTSSPDNHMKQMQSVTVHQGRDAGVTEKSFRETSTSGALRHSISSSQSSNADLEMKTVEAEPSEPETDGVEMVAEDDLAVDVPRQDASLQIVVDEEMCRSGPNDSDLGPPDQPHTPLFLPGPTPSIPSTLYGSQCTSTSESEGQTPSPSPHSFDLNVPGERPRKRQCTSSSSHNPLMVEKKSRSVQMTLDTTGAAWNLKAQGGRGGMGTAGAFGTKKSKMAAISARNNFRSRLSGFLAPGSQMKPIEVDDGDKPNEGMTEVDEVALHDDLEEEKQPEIDEPNALDVTAAGGTPNGGDMAIDLNGPSKSPENISNLVSQSPTDIADDHVSREEVIRTATMDLTFKLDLERLSSIWSVLRSRRFLDSSVFSTPFPSQRLNSSANVANIDDTEAAERELARVIHKDDFSSMHILGQFNLGFIIARRIIASEGDKHHVDDLFIVDQHAADEKYNFETLQQITKIESQKLFQPLPLELTAADELMAIDNAEILRANGFDIMFDEDAKTGQRERVKLVAQPVSKGTTFDMKDLEELLHLMRDQPTGRMVRCSKARAMFAMRACRKSVMVGKALTTSQMTSVIRHMGSMDQPWNCPHGRPTMRHLVNLNQVDRSETRDKVIDWSRFSVI